MIENEFTDALKTLDADGQELRLAADGAALIETDDGVKLKFVVPETAPENVYCRCEVGTLEGLDADALSVRLLMDNHMWQATSGATLSIRDGRVYLTDRRDSRYFVSSDVLAAYIATFASTVRLVREQMETFRTVSEPADGKEAR